jgi:hypothetical protein
MFVPRLLPNAIPPINYPPQTSLCISFLHGLLSLVVVPATVVALSEIFPTWSLNWATLELFCIIGYVYISAIVLQRPVWYHSRYGDSRELFKLVFVAVPAMLFNGSSLGSAPSWRGTLWTWCWFVFGLHFTLLDNIPALQLLGLRFSSPGRRDCSSSDFAIVAIFFAIALFGSTWLIANALLHENVKLLGLRLFILATLVFGPAWSFRGTHSLHLHHYIVAMAFSCLGAGEDKWCVVFARDSLRNKHSSSGDDISHTHTHTHTHTTHIQGS